jgi:IPT/TIG domain
LRAPESIALPAAGVPTSGGVSIVIRGSYLGIEDGVISMRYSGGLPEVPRHTYLSTTCRVISPNSVVSCETVPGVGGNYSLHALVDGGPSNNSTTLFSYLPPTVSGLAGNGSVGGSTEVR